MSEIVWRECEFAGPVGRNPYVRLCRAVNVRLGTINCVRCPVPALVEAVRTTMRIRAARDLSAICYNEILTAQRLAAAALAALPKGESRD